MEGIVKPKFKIIFLSETVPRHDGLAKLRDWCGRFNALKLAYKENGISAGNLSFRISPDDTPFIITGTQIGLTEQMPLDAFVTVQRCDADQYELYVHGKRPPSSESMLHSAIYKKRPEIQAIFHGHSRQILDSAGRLCLATTRREEPYGSRELIQSALDILDANTDFFILKNHGFISMGRDLTEAGENAVAMLEKCKRS